MLDLNPVKVRVGIPEAEIGKVRQGARAGIVIPSFDNRRFHGAVEMVGRRRRPDLPDLFGEDHGPESASGSYWRAW